MKFKTVLILVAVLTILAAVFSACTKTAQPTEPDATATLTGTITQSETATQTFTATMTVTETATATPTATLTLTPVTISFREGVSGYYGTTDAHIEQQNPNTNYGSYDYMQSGLLGVSVVKRALIRFDISSMPAGSYIHKAKLTVTLNNASGSAFSLKLHPVAMNWTEAQVTWNEASTGTSWGPGGSISSANAAMPAYVDPSDYSTLEYEIDNYIVQGWLDSPAGNYGLALKSEDETLFNFVSIYSSEEAVESNRPILEIEYY